MKPLLNFGISPDTFRSRFFEKQAALFQVVHNEILISSAIRELKITKLLIAHRPETIASADRIIELKGGHVFEDGSSHPEPPPLATIAQPSLTTAVDR